MALSGTIRRNDRKPLGVDEDVKRQIVEVFPGVVFTLIMKNEGLRPRRTSFWTLLLKLLEVSHPHWEGSYEGEEFIAVFTLGAGSNVNAVDVTLYGRGTSNAIDRFAALSERAGWKVKF
jgi:hypothetical protein